MSVKIHLLPKELPDQNPCFTGFRVYAYEPKEGVHPSFWYQIGEYKTLKGAESTAKREQKRYPKITKIEIFETKCIRTIA